MQNRNLRTGQLLWYGCATILIGVSFHAFFTAWFASNFGYFDLIRIWKELILLGLVIVSIRMAIKVSDLRHYLLRNPLVKAGLAYFAVIVIMTIAGLITNNVSLPAAAYGFIIDTRFVAFLLVVMTAGYLAPLPAVSRRWILIPGLIVIIFGILQLFLLPSDFLRHFGYGKYTLPAFQPVDKKPTLPRLQSFLRGPNTLGAYMIPVVMGLIALAYTNKNRRRLAILGAVAGIIVLYGSYSRGAAVGLVVAASIFAFWSIDSPAYKRKFFWLSATLLSLSLVALVLLRNNDLFQNVVFHINEKSDSSQSSNDKRLFAIGSGAADIVRHPFGSGVGSAGPASLRNAKGEVRLAENFYLQVGQEAGIIGVLLLILLLFYIAKALYDRKSDVTTRAVLASLVGLLVVNMVVHAFADDTLAYVFFAMIGFSLVEYKNTGSKEAIVKTSTKSENLAKL